MGNPKSKPKQMPRLAYQQDPIRNSVKALGPKWTLLILRDIGFLELQRFGEILRNNPGLTARVLSRRLRDMQREGLLQKNATRDVIVYKLTERGEDAVFILLAFLRYGLKHHVDAKSVSEKVLPSFRDMIREYERLPRWKDETETALKFS